MQQRPSLPPLILSHPCPVGASRLTRRYAARPSRNSMPDRPHDFDGGLRSAVRFVQHRDLRFSLLIMQRPMPTITLRQPRMSQ